MKTITVQLDEKEIEVKRLPLRKYAELIAALGGIPKRISSLGNISNEVILENLPTIITDCYPDVVNVLVIATGITKEEAEELSLLQATNLVLAVWELNDYRAVYDNVKKALARPAIVATPVQPAATIQNG